LYAILDIDVAVTHGLTPAQVLVDWLGAGVRLVQLRAKQLEFGPFLELARDMTARCREAGAIFIVNDRVDVARLAGASGVHLGQDDLTPEDARLILPEHAWIGRSTHNDAELSSALASAATYVATGPVFATRTKNNPDPVIGLDGVRRAAAQVAATSKPLVAIGGISLATGPGVIAAGADSVAIISDLFTGGNVGRRAGEFVRVLDSA
jgi:thiamine-phosphate pyrophosphorylase